MNLKTSNMTLELTAEEIMAMLEGLQAAQKSASFMDDFIRYHALEERIITLINEKYEKIK